MSPKQFEFISEVKKFYNDNLVSFSYLFFSVAAKIVDDKIKNNFPAHEVAFWLMIFFSVGFFMTLKIPDVYFLSLINIEKKASVKKVKIILYLTAILLWLWWSIFLSVLTW